MGFNYHLVQAHFAMLNTQFAARMYYLLKKGKAFKGNKMGQMPL